MLQHRACPRQPLCSECSLPNTLQKQPIVLKRVSKCIYYPDGHFMLQGFIDLGPSSYFSIPMAEGWCRQSQNVKVFTSSCTGPKSNLKFQVVASWCEFSCSRQIKVVRLRALKRPVQWHFRNSRRIAYKLALLGFKKLGVRPLHGQLWKQPVLLKSEASAIPSY